MKKTLVLIWMLLVVLAVQAKETDSKTKDTDSKATILLTGSIVDENSGEALVGVEVKIAGTDKKTYTDFDGNFEFESIKPGEYELVTTYISYEKKAEQLKIDSKENNVKIKLQSSN